MAPIMITMPVPIVMCSVFGLKVFKDSYGRIARPKATSAIPSAMTYRSTSSIPSVFIPSYS